MSEQSDYEFSSGTEPRQIIAPWRVAATQRPQLLDWFLRADLAADHAFARLRDLTGRDFDGLCWWRLPDRRLRFWAPPDNAAAASQLKQRVAAARRRRERIEVLDSELLPPGAEARGAGHALHEPVSREGFVAFYRSAQMGLRAAERWLLAWHRGDADAQAFVGVPIFGLDDVRVDGAIDSDEIRLARPLRSEPRSISLVGELALAMFQRAMSAREVVVCPACGEMESFPDVRHREICSKPQCRSWYRAKWERTRYAAEKRSTCKSTKGRKRRKGVTR